MFKKEGKKREKKGKEEEKEGKEKKREGKRKYTIAWLTQFCHGATIALNVRIYYLAWASIRGDRGSRPLMFCDGGTQYQMSPSLIGQK